MAEDLKVIEMPAASTLASEDALYIVQDTLTEEPLDKQVSLDVLRGGVVASHEFNEVPVGSINGSNAVFLLSAIPVLSSLCVYKNGLLQEISVDGDLTVVSNVLTFNVDAVPMAGDRLRAVYHK